MDDILHGLNKAQREVVTSEASVLQVLAPPGSGKTKTLTSRVAYLIAFKHLKPWNIVTCTFTKKAANEMKERIRSFIGEELSKQIKLGTFHSIAGQYLRKYGQHIGLAKDFGVADTSDSKAIIKRIIKKHDLTSEAPKASGRISANKCKGIESAQFAQTAKNVDQQEFAVIFSEYEAELKASNLLDYDDLLLRCCFLMRTHPQCVSNVEAVLIDEFQDTNTVQYDLMSLFAQQRNMITIVGDPDQSIYGFRHAEIKNLKLMKDQWRDTLTINLEENYRSSGAILHAAQTVIEQDESRPPKKLQATHNYGLRPVLRKLPSAAAEAAWLVAEIKRMCALSGGVLQHSDFAILLRSAALSRVIEAALGRDGMPYRMVGGLKFFERVEVKLVVDYLRVINQPNHGEAVERIINLPPRRIGDATVKSLREEASKRDMSFWDLICGIAQGKTRSTTKLNAPAEKGLASFVNVILSGRRKLEVAEDEQISLVGLINLVAKKIDLQTYLKNKYENEYEAKWSNVEELMAQAADASDPERLKALMEEDTLPAVDDLDQRSTGNEDALSIFLANIALTATAETKTEEGTEPVPQVTISTIHSAKGLEWPVVFLPACYEGSIPHSRSDDNDEERRLLYVGMTRAQAMLYLSCPIKDTQKQETTMSSFLTQPGVQLYFEEHGPSMSLATAKGLATTLRREQPNLSGFNEGKQGLDRDEDNYWPLNGEEAPEERAKWDYGKAANPVAAFGASRPASWVPASAVTTQQQQGFSTASAMMSAGLGTVKDDFNAAYDDLLEKDRLKAIDKKRLEATKNSDTDVPKGRKRQIEGQGSISTFFAKRRPPSMKAESSGEHFTMPLATHTSRSDPLRDISNLDRRQLSDPLPSKPALAGLHKPRIAPLRRAPSSHAALPNKGYMFLSSSPQKPEDEENDPEPISEEPDPEDEVAQPQFKPASTFHTTSLQTLQQQPAARGRRYGVKPSINGWANRARK
ncbi:ATP-dependent DNA helicase srs2 [Extremus antarcticus]|uniref:DNA 3'-5' helicase n=1 Tax=Extremus antarcticus TaxID=702011 RepID=A0AAJ0GHY0_9PEZI|nr:ATP-dependent DNA helicase srs2 [Extremus antarcticus]